MAGETIIETSAEMWHERFSDDHIALAIQAESETMQQLAVREKSPLFQTTYLEVFELAGKIQKNRRFKVEHRESALGNSNLDVVDGGISLAKEGLDRMKLRVFRAYDDGDYAGSCQIDLTIGEAETVKLKARAFGGIPDSVYAGLSPVPARRDPRAIDAEFTRLLEARERLGVVAEILGIGTTADQPANGPANG